MKASFSIFGVGLASLAACLLPACGPSAGYPTSLSPGSIETKSDGTKFFVDENDSGQSTTMSLVNVTFGRLIDEVYDVTGTTLYHRNLVIGSDIVSDGTDYLIETNPISQVSKLTILHTEGSAAYDSAFLSLFEGMEPVLEKGVDPSVLPPFTMIPRNAALVVQFSDLLNPDSITPDTVKLTTGYLPTNPFPVRLLADPNHGAMSKGEFYSTRVIIDPVISELDAQETGLAVNYTGLPPAITTGSANMILRVPTEEDFDGGQFVLLENITGHPVAGLENKFFDFDASTLDVVRALRTGGSTEKVGDPNNGFLPDDDEPQVIGRQPIVIAGATTPGGDVFQLDITFNNVLCASAPKVGDIIQQGGLYLEVTADGTLVGNSVTGLFTRRISPNGLVPNPGQGGHIETPWGLIDKAPAPCFVEFDPPATAGASVVTGVDPFANVIIRFSEPMNPDLITPYDSFTIGNTDIPLEDMTLGSFQVGEVLVSADARDYRFVPTVPFRHIQGSVEDYFINLYEDEGIVDLAGNGLAINFPTVEFEMLQTAATQRSSGKSMRFQGFFEEEGVGKFIDDDGNDLQDIRGQIVWDLTRGVISPRPVDRFSQTIDRNQGVPGWMTTNADVLTGGLLGVANEPFNPLGCRLMHVWRYFDMGLDVVDEAFVNIDVEHVNWAPIGQNVQAEYFPQFRMALSTMATLPDESWITPPNTVLFPNSGFASATFDENIHQDPNNSLTVVHDKEDGYFIDPAKKFKSESQTFMFPYPMNYGKPADEFSYWTFRDTAITTWGGNTPEVGIEPPVLFDTGVLPSMVAFIGSSSKTFTIGDAAADPPIDSILPDLYAPNTDGTSIPSFGLPILLEFRCYASDATVGLNRLDTSLAIGPGFAQAAGPANALTVIPKQPAMRIFSAGGVDSAEKIIYKDPDLQVLPDGGFHYESNQIAPKGAPSPAADTFYYMGQLDFVVRVSRAQTTWHQIADGNPLYFEPVLEPSNERQPEGTSVSVDMRGATTAGGYTLTDASRMNMYGDFPMSLPDPTAPYIAPTEFFLDETDMNADGANSISGITDWTSDLDDMEGLQFFQVRLTFINNAAAGTSPELSTLALAFLGQ